MLCNLCEYVGIYKWLQHHYYSPALNTMLAKTWFQHYYHSPLLCTMVGKPWSQNHYDSPALTPWWQNHHVQHRYNNPALNSQFHPTLLRTTRLPKIQFYVALRPALSNGWFPRGFFSNNAASMTRSSHPSQMPNQFTWNTHVVFSEAIYFAPELAFKSLQYPLFSPINNSGSYQTQIILQYPNLH